MRRLSRRLVLQPSGDSIHGAWHYLAVWSIDIRSSQQPARPKVDSFRVWSPTSFVLTTGIHTFTTLSPDSLIPLQSGADFIQNRDLR